MVNFAMLCIQVLKANAAGLAGDLSAIPITRMPTLKELLLGDNWQLSGTFPTCEVSNTPYVFIYTIGSRLYNDIGVQ